MTFNLTLPREAQPQVAPEYTAAVSEPFFDAAKCHRSGNSAQRRLETVKHEIAILEQAETELAAEAAS